MTPDFIRKYHIYKLIAKASETTYVSKSKIQESLTNLYELHFGNKLYEGLLKTNERTIRRDVSDIESFFGVEIIYKRGAGYYIENNGVVNNSQRLIFDKMELFLASHKEQEWSPYVTTEESSLNTNLDILGLVKAIEEKVEVIVSYNGWFDDNGFEIIKSERIQPLHIKQVNRGWYLLVYNEQLGVKNFCLDSRTTSLEITKENILKPFEFCVKSYFKNSFGILNDNSAPERVVLKVANHHFKYLKSKPLHHSQEVVEEPKSFNTETLDYTDASIFGTIAVTLQPNYEFLIELFKFNFWVKVEEPQWLAEKLVQQHQFLLKEYYPHINTDSSVLI